MVSAKELTKTEQNDNKNIAFKKRLSRLEKFKSSAQQSDAHRNRPMAHERPNGRGKNPKKSYVDGIDKLVSWYINNTNYKVNRGKMY